MKKIAAAILLTLAASSAQADSSRDRVAQLDNHSMHQAMSSIYDAIWPLQVSNHEICPGQKRFLPGFAAAPGEKNEGAFVHHVVDGSPAAQAGLQRGDAVLEINGAGVTHRNVNKASERYEAAWKKAIERSAPMHLKIQRDGAPIELHVESIPACEIHVVYSGRQHPTMIVDNAIVIGASLDRFASTPEQLRMFIARDFAAIMLAHQQQRETTSRGINLAGKVLSIATGRNIEAPGAVIANWRHGPKQAIEADRLSLLLVARAGDDISLAPAYWQGVFANNTGNATVGRLINSPAGTPERLEAIQKTTATILAHQAEGVPLDRSVLAEN